MRSRTAILITVLGATMVLCSASRAAPGDGDGQFPWEGEVSGMNVYVRSGPGMNYYPTTKLNAGDRVVVLGEKFGWYRIVPPPDGFSYIDMTMVNRQPGAKAGTVAQEKVYVRAGSHIVRRKTSTQLVLDRGTTVEIIGEADGFYKIVPPHGAGLYISKQYVKFVQPRLRTGIVERYLAAGRTAADVAARKGASTAAGADATATPLTRGDATATAPRFTDASGRRSAGTDDVDGPPLSVDSTLPAGGEGVAASPDEPGTAVSALDKRSSASPRPAAKAGSTGRYSALLTVVESDLKRTLQQPLDVQDLLVLRPRYAAIAQQTEERVPAAIARKRMQQLTDLTEVRAARASVLRNVEELEAFRSRMSAERTKIMQRRSAAAQEKFDLEGELRLSYAFAPEKRRYRLVDPEDETTIAYVDIPRTIGLDVDQMIGRVVGIRAASQRFSASARVPIAVAKSLTDLTPRFSARHAIKAGDTSNAGNKRIESAKSTEEEPTRPGEGGTPSRRPVAVAGQDPEKDD